MAKFHNYYVLCPLIDKKSFLGVAQDKEQHNIIVTLSRNIVNKYRLSDQKQIVGWTSKDHITSRVIFDKSQNSYIGVFNNNTIKLWENDDNNLDKLKKHKFQTNILKIISKGDSCFVIFKDGNCFALYHALENRNNIDTKPVIKETDTIVDVAYFYKNSIDYICYLIKNSKDNYELLYCPLRTEIGDMEIGKLSKVRVSRDDVTVVGIYLTFVGSVFVLWSDSKMTCYEYQAKTWNTVGSVPWISTSSAVSITWMNKHHLILFGSNLDQDGAIIVAYNTLLGVGSCKYPMKMYTENAKLYCFNNRIIMEASNYIGVLPFVLEPKRNLSSLLGSHDTVAEEDTEIADWGTPTTPQYSVGDKIKGLTKLGLTERNICAQLIPPLLEEPNVDNLFQVLKEFNDIPESILVMLINFVLKLGNFKIEDTTQLRDNPAHPLHFLSYLLFQISFSDALLIPYLKNGLSLNDTLFLMNHISFLLKNPEVPLSVNYETKLFDWYTVLLDAFYQQYLMSKDENVTSMLLYTLNVVTDLTNQLFTVSETLPLINKILCGNEIPSDDTETLPYSIELLEI